MKIILISYLMRVPRLFDFESWPPYLNSLVAMAMLNLPQKRRAKRQSQQDFFAKVGLDLENQGMKSSSSNILNQHALKLIPLRLLDSRLLADLLDSSYVECINKSARLNHANEIIYRVSRIPKVGELLQRMNRCPYMMKAYYAYLCLKPIETSIKRMEHKNL